MFKKILIALVFIVIAFVIVVLMQSPDMHITRSATITAPPEVVFAQVNDFHKWQAWSTWSKMDPNVKNTYEGPASGKDAIFRWEGNSSVGAGNMTITESRPNELIHIRLEFVKPFPGINPTEFSFKTTGNQTTVTWDMTGKKNFVTKAIGIFMDFDKMIGGQFDEGLAQMKAISETTPKA